MALVTCLQCGAQVSSSAKRCPKCGKNPKKKPRRKLQKKDYIIISSILIGVLAIVIGAWFLFRPDPFLKTGREYLSSKLRERYEKLVLENYGQQYSKSDLVYCDIYDFIVREWDRKKSLVYFGIPLENDSIYSVCAYSLGNAYPYSGNGIPYMENMIAATKENLFVVFRKNTPVFIRTEHELVELENMYCGINESDELFHLTLHDALEFEYYKEINTGDDMAAIEAMQKYIVNHYPNCRIGSCKEMQRQLANKDAEKKADVFESSLASGEKVIARLIDEQYQKVFFEKDLSFYVYNISSGTTEQISLPPWDAGNEFAEEYYDRYETIVSYNKIFIIWSCPMDWFDYRVDFIDMETDDAYFVDWASEVFFEEPDRLLITRFKGEGESYTINTSQSASGIHAPYKHGRIY